MNSCKIRTFAALLSCLAIMAGCAPAADPAGPPEGAPLTEKAPTATPSGKKVWIAVIPKASTVDFWKQIQAGANQAAKDFALEAVYMQPTATLTQTKLIDDCIAKHASGIVLAPMSDKQLDGPVKKAQAAGIPVVLIDSTIKTASVTSTVATDNYRAGTLEAQRTIELLNGKGSVVLMRCSKEAEGTTAREKGFLDTIKGSGVTVLDDSYYGGNFMEGAVATSERLINNLDLAHRKGVAVVTVSATNTQAMLTALEATKVAGKVKFVGFDTSAKLLKGLKDCEIDALVVQEPYQIGYLGVKMMVTKMNGESVDPDIKTDAILADRENVNSPELKALITLPAKS